MVKVPTPTLTASLDIATTPKIVLNIKVESVEVEDTVIEKEIIAMFRGFGELAKVLMSSSPQ